MILGLAKLKNEDTYEGDHPVEEGSPSWRDVFGSHFHGSLK